MHLRASAFTAAHFVASIVTSTVLSSSIIAPARANDLLFEGGSSFSSAVLTGEQSSAQSISTNVLLGGDGLAPIRPALGKRKLYSGPLPRAVTTANQRAAWRAWQPTERPSVVVNKPELPQLPDRAIAANPSDQSQTSNPRGGDLLTRTLQMRTTQEEIIPNPSEAIDRQTANSSTIAQEIPSLETIQQIQQELLNIDVPEPARRRTRRVYPGITISNPSGYGADGGQVFAGIGFQSRTRFSGGSNVGTIFGGGRRDGTAGIGFGLGDAKKSVGVQLSYTAASFGGSRAPLSGGLNVKVHKRLGNNWSAAIGGEGIINFGRLPENDTEIEFNDFEGTYYGVVTRTVSLRDDFSKPFSRLTVTGGAGSGRFRSVDQIANGEFSVGVFGSAALQVFPWANVITEWTGQDLAAGLSIAPFPNFPLVITPAVRDIVGEGDGDPRFVMGVGVSLSDIFSSLGL